MNHVCKLSRIMLHADPLRLSVGLQDMVESDMGHNIGDYHYISLSDEAAHAQESRTAFSQAQEPQTAHQASGPCPGVFSAAEADSMQRHSSALVTKRSCSRQVLARGASPEEVNRSLYQYAALALQQPAGASAKRR